MKKILSLVFCLLFICISCSDDGTFNTLSEETLSGNVFGESFIGVQGRAHVTTDEFIEIILTSGNFDCNAAIETAPLYLSIAVPDRIGFHKNVIAIFGKTGEEPVSELNALVEITAVSDLQVSGKLRSVGSSSNNVEGSFQASVCSR